MGYHARRRQGPPAWFIFILGVALIFGVYYLWNNFREFMITGGVSVAEATRQAQLRTTRTEVQQQVLQNALPTRRPSATPRPTCQDFIVSAGSAIVRESTSTSSAQLDTLQNEARVCVIGSAYANGYTWYMVDLNPQTQRIETGYMREDVIRALNPTATSAPRQLATITMTPSPTRGANQPAEPSPTNGDNFFPTLSPTAGTPDPTLSPSPSLTPSATTQRVGF